jgi:uncharacterized protein (TIGR03435 family)
MFERRLHVHSTRLLIAVSAVTLVAPCILAQNSVDAKPIAFDAVTVKPDKAAAGPTTIFSPANGDTIAITNMSLHMMIGFAYDMELHDQIFGLPSWADSESYDVVAKVAEPEVDAFRKLLPRDRNPLLRPVLQDRFHLIVHYETRQLPAYALVVAKNGPKLTAVEPATLASGLKDPGAINNIGRNQIQAEGAPIAILLSVLSQQLGRTVLDRTSLNGNYSFTLKWTPDLTSASAAPAPAADADAGPSIFTAVQEQLGLKLESTKAPTQVLVVDHAERPSDN